MKLELPNGLTPSDPISSLPWDEDRYFAGGYHGGRHTAGCGRFLIEDHNGHIVIYARAAMQRAVQRSIARGGGVRGMCSEFLRDGERRPVPAEATIAEAIAIGKGLR